MFLEGQSWWKSLPFQQFGRHYSIEASRTDKSCSMIISDGTRLDRVTHLDVYTYLPEAFTVLHLEESAAGVALPSVNPMIHVSGPPLMQALPPDIVRW